jgi:cyclic beta-1,2-glucan synthetase
VLDEMAPFLDGPPPRRHDGFFQPPRMMPSSPFEHCARVAGQSTLTGRLKAADGNGRSNDGLNRVGEGGQVKASGSAGCCCAPFTCSRRWHRAATPLDGCWRAHAATLRKALERGLDGLVSRATYDDGTWLGSKDSGECRIDSIAQSWAVLSGEADSRAPPRRGVIGPTADRSDDRLALLFTPPFNDTERDPGYIKGYPPGLRENGGQYSHAAMWAILAFARLGDGAKAASLFALLNPVNHALTPAQAERYKVEPYVVAADVYSVAPHVGRGGWTGTRAPPAGCTGPASKVSWASAGKATTWSSTRAFRRTGRASSTVKVDGTAMTFVDAPSQRSRGISWLFSMKSVAPWHEPYARAARRRKSSSAAGDQAMCPFASYI